MLVVSALLVATALSASAPRAAAATIAQFGPVGPKTIAVDGDSSDWTGAVPTSNTGVTDAAEFIWNDTAGDDTGDGDYTYPKSPDLNRTGLFDLVEVRITADGSYLYVLIKVANLSNTWSGSDGFSTIAAALLIDTTQDGSGMLSARPNVEVAAGSGWEYWAKIGQTGWHPENAKIFDTTGHWAPIQNRANPAFNSVEVSIPLAFIGKDGTLVDGATWRFMLLLGSFDGGGPNGFRDVLGPPWGADWQFGGGSDSPYDPQAIDIAFAATPAGQEAELASYNVATQTYATISSYADVTFGTLGFVADTTPPTISGVTVTPTFNSARIEWATDEIASTMVLWGVNFDNPPVSRDEFVTAHSVTLSNLQPLTTYYYRILSADIAQNWAVSDIGSFTTPAAPPSNIAAWVGNTFTWLDATGDDVGDGDYAYPMTNLVDWFGRADLTWINMTQTATALHVNAKLNANPETEWKQRMGTIAIFIDQDHVFGSGGRSVSLVGTGAELTDPHPMNISVAPDFAWEYLVVATFENRSAVGDASGVGEMFVFNSTWNPAQQRWSLIYLSTAPSLSPEPDTGQIYAKDGNVVDIWLNFSVLGTSDNWTYVIAGMLFDDAARPFDTGGIRQVRPTAGDWTGGGSNGPMNPNVYDLAFYPDAAAQAADLSQYTARAYANITRAMQINFGAKWHGPVVVQNLLDASATLSVSEVGPGESAGLTVYVTNRNVPVAGASVQLAADPAGSVDIVGPNPATTNEFGAAAFTVRGRSLDSDSTVALTATATVETSEVSTVSSLLVRAVSHSYRVFLSAADGALPTGAQTTVTATFTDKGAPVVGASVTLASGNAVLSVVTASATTDAQGQASFTVRAGYSEADVPVTLTATATNATVGTTATLSVTVKGFIHAYALSGSASATVVEAGETTTVTFIFRDAGVARAGATVSIGTPSEGFDVVGDVSKTTDASGQVSFTLRARSVSSDTTIVVTGTASNGTAQNIATASVSIVAQAPAAPVAAAGISTELFIGVTVVLAVIAAVLAVLWMRARRGKPPKTEESPAVDEGEL